MPKIPLLALFLVSCTASLLAQQTRIIKFRQQKLSYHPAHFSISRVKDDRPDTSTIGSVRAGVLSRKMVALNFSGGAAAALNEFIKGNLSQDSSQTPFELHITQLEAAENTGGLRAESEVRMTLAFCSGGKKIVEYKGNNTIKAGIDASRFIEELIRDGLDNMLKQFDTWYAANKEKVQASLSAPSIHVEAVIGTDPEDTDRIAWSSVHPLVLDDFIGKPDDLSRAAAITYSGLDVKYKTETQYDQVKISLTILPFFDKTRSWCRTASRNPKTLRHEQKHFDITAIKACELLTAINAYAFTPANYAKELEQLVKQKDKEIMQWQDQYDRETNHGQIQTAQDYWEKLIRDRLAGQHCYRP